jgi:hypothetical protein
VILREMKDNIRKLKNDLQVLLEQESVHTTGNLTPDAGE